jgi:hypothetical protein
MPIATPVSPTVLGVSKTTANGVLALLITIGTALLTYQIPVALATPQATHVWAYVTAGTTLVLGILRAVVGFLQGDSTSNIR